MKNYSIILLIFTILFIVGIVLLGVYLPSNYLEVDIPYPTSEPTETPES